MIKRVSVIVPVYNDWERVGTLINSMAGSIKAGCELCIELVIVDNGLEPSDIRFNDNKNKFSIRLIHCATPGSYSARNFGASRAKGDILVFADSDVYFDSEYFTNLEKLLRNDNSVLFLAGDVKIFKESSESSSIVVAYETVLGLPQRYYTKRNRAVTANLLVTKRLFQDMGGFNSSLKSGGDFDFCMRVQSSRETIRLEFRKDLVVYHPSRKNITELYRKSIRVAKGQLDVGTSRFLRYLLRASVGIFIDLIRVIDSRKSFDINTLLKCLLFSPIMSVIRISSAIQVLLTRDIDRR